MAELRFGMTSRLPDDIGMDTTVNIVPYKTKTTKYHTISYSTAHEPDSLRALFRKYKVDTEGLTVVAGISDEGRYATHLKVMYVEENGDLRRVAPTRRS